MKLGCIFTVAWVLATVVGFLVSLYWIEIDTKPHVEVIDGVIGGAVIGLAQGLILQQRLGIAPQWILVSIASWGLIAASSGAIGWVAPETLLPQLRLMFGVMQGALVGTLLGLGQWLVFKQHVKGSSWWILASAVSWAIALGVGWTVGGVLRQSTHLFLSEVVGLTLTWMIVAAMTGISLIWLLRKVTTWGSK